MLLLTTNYRVTWDREQRQRGEQWVEDDRAGGRVAAGQRQRHHGRQVGRRKSGRGLSMNHDGVLWLYFGEMQIVQVILAGTQIEIS